jgi:hypothetical protein
LRCGLHAKGNARQWLSPGGISQHAHWSLCFLQELLDRYVSDDLRAQEQKTKAVVGKS